MQNRPGLTLRNDLTNDTNDSIIAVMNYTKYTSIGAGIYFII